MKKQPFQNLVVDHTTLFVEPRFYKVTYALFRVVFGVAPEDVIYEKRLRWPGDEQDKSLTFAARIGRYEKTEGLDNSLLAIVQPTEPPSQSSHVRTILKNRGGNIHCFHIALRTPDLIGFHAYCLERGVNFITPIMKEDDEDLIQVFSGEWNLPGTVPSGFFFEFVQRSPSQETIAKIADARQTFFRDKTFLGLYQEKETEYQNGKVRPFIDDALFLRIEAILEGRSVWEIDAALLDKVEAAMLEYAAARAAEALPKAA
jgi:hypothetical protein